MFNLYKPYECLNNDLWDIIIDYSYDNNITGLEVCLEMMERIAGGLVEDQSECVEWCLKMAKEMRESGREEAAWDYESLARMWDKK